MLQRLARTMYRRRRRVLASWVLLLAGLVMLNATAGGEFADNFTLPGSESQQAADLLRAHGFETQAGKLPPTLFGAFLQQLRVRPPRRLAVAFGWLTLHGDAVTARRLRPIPEQPEIRHDAVRALRTLTADPSSWFGPAAACAASTGRPWEFTQQLDTSTP